jgi:hypothetical protein
MSIYSGSKSKLSFKHIKDTIISPESDDESDINGFDDQIKNRVFNYENSHQSSPLLNVKETPESENPLVYDKDFETSVRETQHELIKNTKDSVDSFGIMRADSGQSPLIKFNFQQRKS